MIKGDKVIAKERIEDADWKGRGIVEIGSQGTILKKRHSRCFAVKWDNGIITWKVLPESIDYSKSGRPLEKNPKHVIRRDFWKVYEGSALVNEETFEPGEKGDCFGNAKKWAVKYDNGDTFIIHGKVTNVEGKTLDHAWVEQDNFVIDPTQGIKMEKDKWYKFLKAVPEAKYTPYQVMINMVRSGKMGPWYPHEVENRFIWRKDKEKNSNSINESEDELGPDDVVYSIGPISKKEESEVVQYIINTWTKKYLDVDSSESADNLKKSFRKVYSFPHGTIVYKAFINNRVNRYFIISKHRIGIGYSSQQTLDGTSDWSNSGFELVIPFKKSIEEAVPGFIGNNATPKDVFTKQEEQQTLQFIRDLIFRSYGGRAKNLKRVIDKSGAPNCLRWATKLHDPEGEFNFRAVKLDGKITVQDDASIDKYWFYIDDPTTRTLRESKIKPEQIENRYPISRKEEQEAIHTLIQRHPMFKLQEAKTNLRKISHKKTVVSMNEHDEIVYKTQYGDVTVIITITKIQNGMIYKLSLYERTGYETFKNSQPWDWVDEDKSGLRIRDLIYESSEKSTNVSDYHGQRGAGAIILSKDTGRILLPYRSQMVQQPHTWGVWGGSIEKGEDPTQALRRELTEELGGDIQIDELIPLYVYRDPKVGFEFHNYLAIVPQEFTPKLNWETEKAEWFKYGTWSRPIHFGLRILLDRSHEIIKAEVKKYMKDPALIKTKKMDILKFRAAQNLIRIVWGNMARGGGLENPRDRFDYEDVSTWLLNEEPTQNMLDYFGHQFYPFEYEPSYKFLEDVERALEELELRYNRKISRYVDPTDPLYVLKKLVKNKSWEKAKYDLAKFSLSGPLVSVRNISDEEAEEIFIRLFLNAMGETFYNPTDFHNTPRLDSLKGSNKDTPYLNTFLRYYLPRGITEFPSQVKVYRGTNSPHSKIRPGDFCTFDKDYARVYIRGKYGAVTQDILPTHDLLLYKVDPGQSEMIYWPEGHKIQKYSGPIPKFKDFFLQNR